MITEAQRMKLAPQGIGPGMVYVTDAVRKMMDEWMLERFGTVDGLMERDGVVTATCRSCDKDYEWEGDPLDGYDHHRSYCGGSPRCCP